MTSGVERHFKVVGGKDTGDQIPPNPSTVEVLERALELAKKGTIQEVVVCAITYDKGKVSGWSDTDSVFTMLGALIQTTTDYQNREIVQQRPDYTDGMH